MKPSKKIFTALFCGTLLTSAIIGCDDPNASTIRPATRPSAVAAKTSTEEPAVVVASYPIKPPSVLSINGNEIQFPAAKLVLIDRHSGFTFRLCSDDPPTAIDPGYAGNSYVLDMRLPIDRMSDLPGSAWDFKPADGSDSIDGIFLHGTREQLRPIDVHVQFQKDGTDTVMSLSGTFSHTDSHMLAAPSQRVTVNAFLRVPEASE
jgi:hypothetical protein